MRASQITHGDADAVAEYLSVSEEITPAEVHGAAINALTRVARLERKLEKLQAALALAIAAPPTITPAPAPALARAVAPSLESAARHILEFADNRTPLHPGSLAFDDLRDALAAHDRGPEMPAGWPTAPRPLWCVLRDLVEWWDNGATVGPENVAAQELRHHLAALDRGGR